MSLARIFTGGESSAGIVWPSVIHLPISESSRSCAGRRRCLVAWASRGASPVLVVGMVEGPFVRGEFAWHIRVALVLNELAVFATTMESHERGCSVTSLSRAVI